MKKIILVISFIILSGFLFGFSAPDTQAVTTTELEAQLNKIQTQLTELQGLLAEISLPQVLGEEIGTPDNIEPEAVQITESFAPGRLLFRFKDNVPETTQKDYLKKFGFKIEKEIKPLKVKVVSVPKKMEKLLARTLSAHSNIAWVEPDYVAEALLVPDDTYFDIQWGMTKVQAPEAWDISIGDPNVKIAILDTGIDMDHPDLASKIEIVSAKDFSGSPNSYNDIHGHGTHCAGIAAAITNNHRGVAGVCPDCSLMNVKVLDDKGKGTYAGVANGIIWAADNGADIISLSLGGPSDSQALEDAVNYAWNKGVVVVAGAGNNGDRELFYPAYYANSIAVAATDRDDAKPSWSTFGEWVDVAAPGSSIYSTIPDSYGYRSGTSMACPHVSGLAGLLASITTDKNDNGFINDEIRFIIEGTTDAIDWGFKSIANGRINAFSAVSSIDESPFRTLTGTIQGTSSGTVNVNPPDVDYTSSFSRDYDYGTLVTLTATADADSIFTNWPGGACIGTGPCSLYMLLDRAVTATFNIAADLTISSTAGGSVLIPGEGTLTYSKDEVVNLLANADLGYKFVKWTGDTDNIANIEDGQTTIAMQDDYSIAASFETAPECTTYNGYTYCRGFKSADPPGSSCNAACSERGYSCPAGDNMFSSLSEISEVATALGLLAPGESYSSNGCVNCSPYILKSFSTGAKWISYNKEWDQVCTHAPLSTKSYESITICRCEGTTSAYTLSVNSSPVTGISISSATGHSGTTNYSKTDIELGTSVSLTAPATHGDYQFTSWSGCDSVTSTTCYLTMNSDKSVTANYEVINRILSVSKAGTGSGTVTSDPAGINCGATCSASYDHNTSVTLTATPAADSTFTGWSGACTGKEPCTVEMNSNLSVTATFDTSEPPPECTTYNGYIYCRGFKSTDPPGSSCQAACSERGYTCPNGDNMFRSVSEVAEVAVKLGLLAPGESYRPGTGSSYYSPYIRTTLSTGAKYVFYHSDWKQVCRYGPSSGSGYERVRICRCEEALPTHTLSVTKAGTGSGNVTSDPAGINCGATCSAPYDYGTSVTLTATPAADSTFAGWSGSCTGKEPCTVEMNSNLSVTATFDTSEPPSECTTYNGYIYCRGFKSTDPPGSSCKVACSARGYTCPVGNNMFRSVSEVAEVATTLGLLAPGESYYSIRSSYYGSPFIRTRLADGAKAIHYDPAWHQKCTYAPRSSSRYEFIKICRCEEVSPTHTLSVSKSGTGSGNVTSDPAGINCGATCSASYDYGTSVTLTVTPAADSTFAGWSGACTGKEPCTVEMNSNLSVTATFDKGAVEGCTIYNGYTYCRGFKSTDLQGSSCQAACSARGYTCPVGDNMFRSLYQVAKVAVELDLLAPGESYRSVRSSYFGSPYIGTRLADGVKYIYYDPAWHQKCTYAPRSSSRYEFIKICRCEEVVASQNLENIENQLASMSNTLSELIGQIGDLTGK